MTDGVVVVDKAAGMTSHDVVDRIRRLLGTRRVGHGGTLDPDATGVLIVGVGKATRFLQFAQAAPKRYTAHVRFGVSTTTQDRSGEVIERRDASSLTGEAVAAALPAFTGEIDQVPPMVSAVKIGGERLYAKARRGEDVERAARRVTVHSLELQSFEPGATADAVLDVRCSGGTYVRTIAHDLGEALGTGAHLTELRRTEAGGFTLEDAVSLDDLSPSDLLPLAEVVRDLPPVRVSAEDEALVADGRPLPAPEVAEEGAAVAVLRDGRLLGVYRRRGAELRAERVVPR
ncbi:MAG TPA: tRNA pseudouridine(55) synthase TruB [Actinomycetota bacterium]|nr:tRNA pseudouridine(55) synthase TruB [Actinomycetota bacterium]